MTTKILKGHYASAYHLQAPVTTLSITASGYVAGSATYGVYTGAAATAADTVVNHGTVMSGGTAVSLGDGGLVINGTPGAATPLVEGATGVVIAGAAGTVENFSTIDGTVLATGTLAAAADAGVRISDGGSVANDSAAALIEGQDGVFVSGAAGTVKNLGVIEGFGSITPPADVSWAKYTNAGVYLADGGSVTNGSATTTSAVIEGQCGISISGAAGSVQNFGTVETSAEGLAGIFFYQNGDVTNGSASDTSALVSGYQVGIAVDAGAINNFGTVIATGGTIAHAGIVLGGLGVVTNGSATDTTALISGYNAILSDTSGSTVCNFGAVEGLVRALGGETIINGSASDFTASISDVELPPSGNFTQLSDSLTNFGTIGGLDDMSGTVGIGVYVMGAGQITNGSTLDTAARITGQTGMQLFSLGGEIAVANFATILGASAEGIFGGDQVSIVNGAKTGSAALVAGSDGVLLESGTIINYGAIVGTAAIAGTIAADADAGVRMGDGGLIINGSKTSAAAQIEGEDGVFVSGAAGTVTNLGVIEGAGSINSTGGGLGSTYTNAGVYLTDGGSVTNGAATVTGAVIEGQTGLFISGATGTVKNFATVETSATGLTGILLYQNGDVTNGSASDTSAMVSGYKVGVVVVGVGTVSNFGTITGGGTTIGHGGVVLGSGGLVTNGSGSDITALISAPEGVVSDGTATIRNFGVIEATAFGVALATGGKVTNGSRSDYAKIYSQGGGVGTAQEPATVVNYGVIAGGRSFDREPYGALSGVGVELAGGGLVTNGYDGKISGGIIYGTIGVYLGDAPGSVGGTVVNFHDIEGGKGDGVQGGYSVTVINRSFTGEMEGYDGVSIRSGTIKNYGIITGTRGWTSQTRTAGVYFTGQLTNHDEISGVDVGVMMGSGVVTNFGTIQDDTSTPIGAGILIPGALTASGANLNEVTNGAPDSARATIDGYSGIVADVDATVTNFGTVKGFGTAGYAVRLTTAGSTLIVEAGSTLLGSIAGGGGTLDLASGTGTIASIVGGAVVAPYAIDPYDDFGTLEIGKGASFTLTGAGTVASGGVTTLDVAGTLGVTGSLTVSGTVDGAGTLALSGGETDFDAGADLSVAKVAVSGAATVVSVDTPLTFAGLWTQTGGTVAGTGSLTLTGAGDLLENLTLSAAKVEIDAASATLAGAVDLTRLLTVISPKFTVAGATVLTGGGALQLSNIAAVTVMGASAASLLENSDKIEGAGNLGGGQLRLTNEAAGIIDGNAAKTLTIDTGAGAFANDGLVEAVGTGGLTIVGAVNNSGTLEAAGGTLTVDGVVTGAGGLRISDGAADFAAGFSQNVAFTTAGGELELADSQAYAGTISGFSKTGATSLDLEDINFATATETYSGTAASGVLTVTDGTHTAKISLTGNYLSSVWNLTADSSGGTVVTDPTSATPSVHGLVAAMASFAPATSSGGSIAPPASTLGHALAAPQACHA